MAIPQVKTSAIKESHAAGGGKPAYTIDVKYPQWPGNPKSQANTAAAKVVRDDVSDFKKNFDEVVGSSDLGCELEENYKVVYSNPGS